MTEIWRALSAKKEQLPIKAKPYFDTTVMILKPLPKPVWSDPRSVYNDDKKKVIKALAKQVQYYTGIADLNVDVIRPNDSNQFDRSGRLSGYYEFWCFIDQTIEFLDKPQACNEQMNGSGRNVTHFQQRSKKNNTNFRRPGKTPQDNNRKPFFNQQKRRKDFY